MSLVPLIFRDFWTDMDRTRPSRLMDQHFGLTLDADDLLTPMTLVPSRMMRQLYRPWRQLSHDTGATVSSDKDKFQVNIDVQQFSPNELTVKVTENNTIVVEGKHEEKQDEHGYVSRQFVRRYVLPEGHDLKNVQSSLSSDGVLTISAPKLALQENTKERVIPIMQTGPARPVQASSTPIAVEQKQDDKKQEEKKE